MECDRDHPDLKVTRFAKCHRLGRWLPGWSGAFARTDFSLSTYLSDRHHTLDCCSLLTMGLRPDTHAGKGIRMVELLTSVSTLGGGAACSGARQPRVPEIRLPKVGTAIQGTGAKLRRNPLGASSTTARSGRDRSGEAGPIGSFDNALAPDRGHRLSMTLGAIGQLQRRVVPGTRRASDLDD
jgi:hypothetical protein